ncbi:MAG: ACP S-malonyltransferase [Gemmatimonadetes bacterium]|nr:ACP S-malonyltransferase [Gemmatimonadota bacterium]
MSTAILFPGQGSQHVGLGLQLARAYPEAAHTFEEADDILGFALSRLCWEGPEDELVLTQNAQPAILTHSVAVFRIVGEPLGEISHAAGHSLGEYSAHVAAGTLSFADAVAGVRLRGQLMFAAGTKRAGTMAAVIGLTDDELIAICEAASVGGRVCVPANFNCPGQVVISGDEEGVEEGMRLATEAGARRVVPLTVSGAFHSPLMAPAAKGLRAKLNDLNFGDPHFPVVSNVTSGPVTDGDTARELLVDQLTSPVRWAGCMREMLSAGVDRFIEMGPGSVLCGLSRRNARGVPCRAVGEPEDIDALLSEGSDHA